MNPYRWAARSMIGVPIFLLVFNALMSWPLFGMDSEARSAFESLRVLAAVVTLIAVLALAVALLCAAVVGFYDLLRDRERRWDDNR